MYSYGPPHMAKQKQDDQLEITYSSYVKTQEVTPKTCRRRWIIGRSRERGSGISVLAARHDDDEDTYPECVTSCFFLWRLIQGRDKRLNDRYSIPYEQTPRQHESTDRWLTTNFSGLKTSVVLYFPDAYAILPTQYTWHFYLWDKIANLCKAWLWWLQTDHRLLRVENLLILYIFSTPTQVFPPK